MFLEPVSENEVIDMINAEQKEIDDHIGETDLHFDSGPGLPEGGAGPHSPRQSPRESPKESFRKSTRESFLLF